MTAPHRRWPQFTSRTLFIVVTAIAFWLGWQLHDVRLRRATIFEIWNNSVTVNGGTEAWVLPGEPAPLVRGWLGDLSYPEIGLPRGADESEGRRIQRMFPESKVYLHRGDAWIQLP